MSLGGAAARKVLFLHVCIPNTQLRSCGSVPALKFDKLMVFLEFEQPLEKLYEQLEKIKQVEEEGDVDMSDAIKELENKIKTTRRDIYGNLTGWQKVQLSRHPERPYTFYYINQMCRKFVELHGDRTFKDDKAIVGGVGNLDGQTVVIIGHQKGVNTKMRQYRNFGMANPEGYRKALRLMKLAERFNFPVVCLIDTPGAYPGIEAEERGQAEAIARNLFEMAQLKVPIICVVIGEGASGGAIGIGLGDRVFMLENTWYSVISPESCSSILWRSWDFKEQAADALKLTADDMLSFGLIDEIIKEPTGGAHANPEEMAKTSETATEENDLRTARVRNRRTDRSPYQQIRQYGCFQYRFRRRRSKELSLFSFVPNTRGRLKPYGIFEQRQKLGLPALFARTGEAPESWFKCQSGYGQIDRYPLRCREPRSTADHYPIRQPTEEKWQEGSHDGLSPHSR